MSDWFTIDQIDADTFIISEYRHWEETHCYLLNGADRSLLIDTGLGICDISKVTARLTDRPVMAIPTHVHWDHIGGLWHYPDFAVQQEELAWIQGSFPLPTVAVRRMLTDRCQLPLEFDLSRYQIFQGMPSQVLAEQEVIDLGGRMVTALHTPGHSPGHLCFYEASRGYLFTGDLAYKGTLFANYPSTDPQAYRRSLQAMAKLPAERIFPAHHSLAVQPEILLRMADEFQRLDQAGRLQHGSGLMQYQDWAVLL